jgi:hypothetical protein
MREGIVPTKSEIVSVESKIVSMEFRMVPTESERVSEWQEINFDLINID